MSETFSAKTFKVGSGSLAIIIPKFLVNEGRIKEGQKYKVTLTISEDSVDNEERGEEE